MIILKQSKVTAPGFHSVSVESAGSNEYRPSLTRSRPLYARIWRNLKVSSQLQSRLFIAAVLAVFTTFCNIPSAVAASVVEVTGFGSNPGNLKMFRYIPDGLAANRPVVVVMHGCFQSAADMDAETGWTALADAWQFAVVFPQTDTNNQTYGCFRAYDSGHNERDVGEAASIREMVAYMESNYTSDPARTFVTGFSAGGWMTNVLLATYPDVFEGGAPMAGAPYGCATTQAEFESCNTDGKNLTPQQWGDRIRAGYPDYSGPRPAVFAFQGSTDAVVHASHLNETMEAWTNAFAIDQVPENSTPLRSHPQRTYKDGSGNTRVRTLQIAQMGHAVAVDPGTGPGQCGQAALATIDVKLCAAFYAGTFFGLNPGSVPNQLSFGSNTAQDGYVTAYLSGSSPAIGGYEDTYGIGLGHQGSYRYHRGILSFDTSAIPDGATITRAYIRITWNTSWGDPWNDPYGNSLVVDVHNGCFGSSCSLQAADWGAVATASGGATVPAFTIFTTTQYSTNLSTAARNAINTTGTTQMRLRFAYGQYFVNYSFIKNGPDIQLVVEYL